MSFFTYEQGRLNYTGYNFSVVSSSAVSSKIVVGSLVSHTQARLRLVAHRLAPARHWFPVKEIARSVRYSYESELLRLRHSTTGNGTISEPTPPPPDKSWSRWFRDLWEGLLDEAADLNPLSTRKWVRLFNSIKDRFTASIRLGENLREWVKFLSECIGEHISNGTIFAWKEVAPPKVINLARPSCVWLSTELSELGWDDRLSAERLGAFIQCVHRAESLAYLSLS